MSKKRPRITDTPAAKEGRANFRHGYELGVIRVGCWLRRLGFRALYDAIIEGDFAHYEETGEVLPLRAAARRKKRAPKQLEFTGDRHAS